MIQFIKNKLCKWGIHSHKIKVVYPQWELKWDALPQFYCLWCKQNIGQVFGKPPENY